MFRVGAVLPLLLICAPSLAAAQAAPAPSSEPAPGARELADIRAAVDAGRASEAARMFDKLLSDSSRRDWALQHREGLLEESRRIAFATAYTAPAPATLIRGALVEWTPRNGAIVVAYRPDNLGDFHAAENGARVHPLLFRGDYTATLRAPADSLRGDGVRLLLAATTHSSYCVCLAREAKGDDLALQILRLTADNTERVAEAKLAVPRAAYRLAVRVTGASVQVSLDGKPVLRAAKTQPDFGQFGLWPCEFSELRLEGIGTTAWIDSLRDQHRQAALQQFVAAFDPAQHLPPWLFAAPTAALELPPYPCVVEAHMAADVAACVQLLEQQRFDECLARAAAARALPPRIVIWLRALAFAGKRAFGEALVCAQELLRRTPDFARAQELEARLLWGTGQRNEAISKARALVAQKPDYVDAVTALISFELCSGHRTVAAALQATARARGLHSDEFERVTNTLAKAERGPDWARRFVHASKLCEVASDIDQRTCVEVASALHEAFATFSAEIAALDQAVQPVRVFVFAGESSYRVYLTDVIGGVPIHTTGLYSHALGQILLWQPSDKARMLQTVRHEGLHWYLEQVLRAPPRWLNEGLAQYYESASARGDRVGATALRTQRLAALRSKELAKLSAFIAFSDAEFYADPALAYGQSWALVSMLREGSHAQRGLLSDLIRAFTRDQTAAQIYAELLPRAKLEALDRDLAAFVGATR